MSSAPMNHTTYLTLAYASAVVCLGLYFVKLFSERRRFQLMLNELRTPQDANQHD